MNYINLKKHIILSQIILLILASGGVLHIYFGGFLTFLFIFFLVVLFYISNNVNLKLNVLRKLYLSELFFLFFLLFNYFTASFDNDISFYVSLFFRISIVNIFIFYLVNFGININKYLYKSLIFIIIFSLINFILGFFIVPFASHKSDLVTLKTIFYVFNYESEAELIGYNIYRNQSFFWEPGILSIFMNLFILLSFVYKKFNLWFYAAIFIIISTFSSTGILLLVTQLFYFLYSKRSIYFIKVLGIIATLLIIYYVLIPNITEKTGGSGVGSFDLRTFDLFNALSIFQNNFFWGIGLDQDVYLKLYEKYEIFDIDFTYNVYTQSRGNTNSLLMIFASFGIFNGLLFYYYFFNKVFFRDYSWIFYIIIIFSVSSEPLILSNFFLMIPLYSFYNKVIVE